jgi:hypothetical protein
MAIMIPENVRISQVNSRNDLKFVRWETVFSGVHSRAVFVCHAGHEWTSFLSVVLGGSGCRECMATRFRNDEQSCISKINAIDGYSFVRWESEYKNSRSRAICRCPAGHEYQVSVIKIVNSGRRCPKCAIKLRSSSQIMPAELRIADIERMGNKFVKWDGEFTNSKTKAVVECESGHQWSASINNLVNHGKGCPACFPGGFNQTKSGFVYALRSECGTMIKVGVSNNPKSRIPKLRSETPFDFGVIMMLGMSGIDAIRAERYFHAKYKSVGMRGFNGATEWLVTTGELLNEIREMGR